MNNIPIINSYDQMDQNASSAYHHSLENASEKTKRLARIAHLKLNIPKFDYETAYQEVMEHTKGDFTPIEAIKDYKNRLAPRGEHPTWCSRALVNYTTDSSKYFSFYDREDVAANHPDLQPEAARLYSQGISPSYKHMNYYKTDLYDKMPYITNYLTSYVFSKPQRILLWNLRAGGIIGWHHHSAKDSNYEFDHLIVHIPITTHPAVEMLVKIDDVIHNQHYELGSAYIFNSVQDHAVNNNSQIDRIHIVAMVAWNDKKLWENIEASW